MRIDWDAPIPMDDGIVLRADVFRPIERRPLSCFADLRAYAKGLPFRMAIPTRGKPWRASTRMWWRARPTFTRTGKSWIRRNGCRTATPACAWTAAAAGALRATSIHFRREKRATSRRASPGPASSRGAAAKSASTAFRITGSISGKWRRCSRRILRRCACGKARRSGTAILRITAGFIARSGQTGIDMQVKTVQHGLGTRGPRSRATGDLVCGPETLTEARAGRQPVQFRRRSSGASAR